jgi:hypothetical protein
MVKNCKKCFSSFRCRGIKEYQKKKFCSPACYWQDKKGRISPKKGKKYPHLCGENHPLWKGDEVGYKCLHDWVRSHKGKPTFCANLNCKYPRKNTNGRTILKPSRFEWANVFKKTKRDLSNYVSLCVLCHRHYDYKLLKIKF